MKTILVMFILFSTPQSMASSSRQCDLIGKIEKSESATADFIDLKIRFSRRALKTWILGSKTCKHIVGKIFSLSVPASDDFLNELKFGASVELTAFLICPDGSSACFWYWRNYKLPE